MKLTIIPSDKAVVKDNVGRTELSINLEDIPSNIHALQWLDDKGYIEFINDADGNKPLNEPIEELPTWALDCVEVFDAKITAENAPLTIEQIQLINRSRRDGRLRDCDWTQAADSPLSAEKKAEWAAYRQILRDLPSDIEWLSTERAPFPTSPA